MRIREIYFNNFRSFRGEHRISFVDPVTDKVRPVTVLGGSNGTGKTTILEAIEALITLNIDFVAEVKETGLVCLTLELATNDFAENGGAQELQQNNQHHQVLNIAIGRGELLPQSYEKMWPRLFGEFVKQGKHYTHQPVYQAEYYQMMRTSANMEWGKITPYGGLLYFPHDRQFVLTEGGPIEPSPDKKQMIFRFSNEKKWQGSLEQLWVWQNYLDLEQGTKKRDNLKPFVESVENVLGSNRKITIKEGRVTVPTAWSDNGEAHRVRLDQLSSGEQQVLLLFGELARRRRKGVIIAIDEIENSLHPTLQRLVMWNLRKIAREWDAQVIVTTHSLEVINTVRGGAFINLDYLNDAFDLPLTDDATEEAA